jgi:hypothetical protein
VQAAFGCALCPDLGDIGCWLTPIRAPMLCCAARVWTQTGGQAGEDSGRHVDLWHSVAPYGSGHRVEDVTSADIGLPGGRDLRP